MKSADKKKLVIFIEPTPYILGLLEQGFKNINEKCDVVFLTENLTQNWELQSRLDRYSIIRSKKQIISCLIDIILKRKYRIVHVAGWNNPFIFVLILMSRLFFYSVIVETDTPLNLQISIWKKIIKKWLYPILFQFPAFFLPGGTRQANYLMHYGVSPKKIIHAQMTVDVEYIQNYIKKIAPSDREKLRIQYGSDNKDVVFLFVGRLLDWKGIRELIDAFNLIDAENVKLWIVGAGDLIDEVKFASQENKKIIYFGRISGDLLWNVYYAADVFVIPSHYEPWGLVVNEAMAAGLPIIATESVGCVDDLVLNKNQGLIVQSKNSYALFIAMNDMLRTAEKRRLMAESASKKIAGWTLQNEASNITAAWDTVLSRYARF